MFSIRTRYLILLVFLSLIYETLSCGGYDINIRKLKNCGTNNVIQVKQRVSVRLDDKCNVIPKGCLKVIQGFSAFNASFSAQQDGIGIFEDTFDGCKILASEGMMSCPIKPGEMCVNGEIKVSVAEYKDFLPVFSGEFALQMEVNHNPGKSCFKLEGSLFRKKNKTKF